MARPPKKRKSYMGDAQNFMSFARAVQLDDRMPKDWRDDVDTKVRELVKLLLDAPLPKET